MKVLVCGSRHFNDFDLMFEVLSGIFKSTDDVLIHGDARGADKLSEYVVTHYLFSKDSPKVEVYPADWDTYGKKAGPIRNYQMLKEGKPDLVVAFLAPNSRGTKHMVDIATKAGVEVKVINIG